MEVLIKRAKQKFREKAKPHWKLNEPILQFSITKFKSLFDQGLIDNEEEVISLSLMMATEFD